MVKSKSGSTPYLIFVNRVKCECDDKCPHFKSIKLCSHTVAASEVNGELREFISWFKTKKSSDSPNLVQLGMHGMPAGAGRKSDKVTKRKQTSKRVAPSDDNRVPLDTTPRFQALIQDNYTSSTIVSSNSPFSYDYTTSPPSQYSYVQLDSHGPSSGGPSTSGGFPPLLYHILLTLHGCGLHHHG